MKGAINHSGGHGMWTSSTKSGLTSKTMHNPGNKNASSPERALASRLRLQLRLREIAAATLKERDFRVMHIKREEARSRK